MASHMGKGKHKRFVKYELKSRKMGAVHSPISSHILARDANEFKEAHHIGSALMVKECKIYIVNTSKNKEFKYRTYLRKRATTATSAVVANTISVR